VRFGKNFFSLGPWKLEHSSAVLRPTELSSSEFWPRPSYLMVPVGPGKGPRLQCNFFLGHHKQNGAKTNGEIEYQISNEFSTYGVIHFKPGTG